MKSFSALEDKHKRTPIHLADPDAPRASGVLVLARNNTEVILSTEEPIDHTKDSNGWFSLRLRASNGEAILLHNALSLKNTNHFRGDKNSFEEKIFPNAVLFEADTLDDEPLINLIGFSFPAIENFFTYQFFEHIFIDEIKKEHLDALNELRKANPKSINTNHPRELFVAHQFPERMFDFEINDCKYSVSPTHYITGPSNVRIDAHIQLFAGIEFQEAVGIDEALDHAWAWKRFFEQIALQPFSVSTMFARSKGAEPNELIDIYLPNVKNENAKPHAGDIPLNRWDERETLAQAMKEWLSHENERRSFRLAISRVIEQSRKRESLSDIVTMCAGLESLSELDEGAQISYDQLNALTAATQAEAIKQRIAIDPNRIAGILNLLNNQSLPRRLKILAKKLQPSLSKDDCNLVINAIRGLRTIAAHGQALPELTFPKVSPTVQALLGFCVLFDLTTCRVPERTSWDSRILALKHTMYAIDELRKL